MAYYVLGARGEQYGPATLDTLNQWIKTEQVQPSSRIKDIETGREFVAFALPGLKFTGTERAYTPPANPVHAYARLNVYPNSDTHVLKTVGLFFVGLMGTVLTPLSYIASLVALIGIINSLKAENANRRDDPMVASTFSVLANTWANWSFVALLVALCLYLIVPAFAHAL